MKEICLQEVIEKLQAKGTRYVSLIQYLQRNPVEWIYEGEGGGILAITSGDGEGQSAVIAVDHLEQLLPLKERFNQINHFWGIESWLIPTLKEGRELISEELCYTYYLPQEVEIPRVERLPEILLELAPVIDRYWTYTGDWTLPFIETCLQEGPSSVKWIDGQPVAWAVIQDDGAMGCMYVLEGYRRKGYAQEVTYDLIQKLRERGQIPFVHIVQTNQPSIRLAESMGFQRLKEIAWLEVGSS